MNKKERNLPKTSENVYIFHFSLHIIQKIFKTIDNPRRKNARLFPRFNFRNCLRLYS